MKKFFEVFRDLQVNSTLEQLFSDVLVSRVQINKDHSWIQIHIRATHLIEKEAIRQMEEEIRKKLFSKRLRVRLIEHFRLSGQYNAKSLYEVYQRSILQELQDFDILLFQMLNTAKVAFPDEETMDLTIPSRHLYASKDALLRKILSKLFVERCNVPFSLEIRYEEVENVRKTEEPADLPPKKKENAVLLKGEDPFSTEAGTVSGGSRNSSSGRKRNTERGQAETLPKMPEKSRPLKAIGVDGGGFKKKRFAFRRSENEDVLYGRDFEGEVQRIADMQESTGRAILGGQILTVDEIETKNGKFIFRFSFTDFSDSIMSKIFVDPEDVEQAREFLYPKNTILLSGTIEYDSFDRELELSHIQGIRKYRLDRKKREDHAKEKRVELHLHTKMSDMDGVSDVADYIDAAISFGMDAMAITDHGVVQAFPDASHHLSDIRRKDFKLLFGCEIYLVDDLSTVAVNPQQQELSHETVVFDIETTGFSNQSDHIIEIGAVKLRDNEIVDSMDVFVNPGVPIPFRITQLTSITDDMVMNAQSISEVLPAFLEFCGDAVIVAHNAEFDTGFIREAAKRLALPYHPTIVDTVGLSRLLLPRLSRYKLDTVARELKVSLEHHHRAVDDARCTAEIYRREVEMLRARGVRLISEIDSLDYDHAAQVRKLQPRHCIVLCKNDLGRINLYRMISESHLKYFKKSPRIPKSLLRQYREGLILGSACVAGELFQAMIRGAEEEQLLAIASFYDYLEIQPLGNNAFMLASDRYPAKTEEDLIRYNKHIIALADQLGKPVCATCDCHYLNPEDDIYRKIIQAGRGFEEGESEAKLYFRTTKEMLEEFPYLSSDRCKEIVIDNPRKIADMCEYIEPVRPDKCPPVIENSDRTLREICYETAHRLYGPELPKIVRDRLEKELSSIISNGYSVMYIIAQKLVDKSMEDGYLVGSRGSVGSSFVATMAHITEVNPLSPHYVCPNCYWSDFDSEEVKKYSGMAGCDMPKRICPKCGTMTNRYGFDIPFETFLGFEGDKEPDIDLNFSGEYQAKAHAYTGVIFGEKHTFKAGTIGTLADKTAYGMVKKYYEERGIEKRPAEINRLVQGCVGVRRTTGQHPGGIVVLPHGEEIHSFTPVQHPANDNDSPIITTHFDYHKIDHNLLKLDILGHDDPTMIRKLQDLTGIDPVRDIPLDCPEVMSLFQSTEVLGIRPEDIQGVKLGCLGIPEFGTSFAMQMVEDTKPKYFSDLIRISGLSHGTDVYLNNAQDLIRDGVTTLQSAICCRDDIMVYLIHMGLEPGLAFNIMEKVRKGIVAKGKLGEKWDQWKEEMKKHGVEDWYIGSCEKIKYMFPKAHAAAYVMMAWRVAYCKVFYPREYYTAYYSIRADGFDYDKMCNGIEQLRYHIREYQNLPHPTATEKNCLRDMKICEEMYARGIEFAPIDIYKAKASDFQMTEDGRIMPSFSCMAGLGEAVALGIEEGAKSGGFLSKDDFINRTHCPKGFAEKFAELGLLGDIPESNQMSVFDFFR